MKKLVALLAACLVSNGVLAEGSTSSITIPDIEVVESTESEVLSEGETYQSIHSEDVVSSEKLQNGNVDHVSELLKDIPGVNVTGGATPQDKRTTIRGMGGTRIVHEVDGAKRYEQTQGAHSSDIGVEADSLKAVEVQKGGDSITSASGAMGGSITYKTIDPSDILSGKKKAFKAKGSYSSASRSSSFAATGAAKVAKRTEMLIQATGRTVEQVKTGGEEEGKQDLDFNRSTYMVKLTNRNRLGSFKGKASYAESLSKNSSYRSGSGDATSNYEDKTYEGTLEHQYSSPLSSLINVKSNFYGNKRESVKDTHTPWLGYQSTVGRVEDKLTTYGGKVANSATIPFGDSTYLHSEVGVDYGHVSFEEDDGGGDVSFYGESEGSDYGTYTVNDLSFLNDKVVLNFGARANGYKRKSNKLAMETKDSDGSTFSNVLGLTVKPLPYMSVFGKVSNANRAPEARELYYGGGTPFPCHWPTKSCNNIPNADLTEEFAFGREVGVGFEKKSREASARIKVSYFYDVVSDYIDKMPFMYKLVNGDEVQAGPSDATHRDYRYQNLSKVLRRGIEAKLETSYKTLDFGAKFSSINMDCIDCPVMYDATTVSEPMMTAPADKVVVNLDYNFSESNFKIGYKGNFVDSQNRLSERYVNAGYATPGYSVHNFVAAWAPTYSYTGKFRVDLAVNNFTNKKYKVHSSSTGTNELGRSFNVSFSKYF